MALSKAPTPKPRDKVVFISYQWDSQNIVRKIYDGLTREGFICWMDEWRIYPGDRLHGEIVRGLNECQVVVACLTARYFRSENCRREISLADAWKKRIIPIQLENIICPEHSQLSFIFSELVYIKFFECLDDIRNWKGEKVGDLIRAIDNHLSSPGSDGRLMKSLKTQVDNLLNWEQNCVNLLAIFSIETNMSKYAEDLELVFIKNEKTKIDIVFIGKTSSGKSLIINELLGINAMRSGAGHTTPSAVRIQTTTGSSSYYQYSNGEGRCNIDFNDEQQLFDFHDIVDRNSVGSSHTDQCIDVFISKNFIKRGCILSDNVTILDTPGMERDVFETNEVKMRVLDADALVLVVDIISWSDNEAIRNMLNNRNLFVKPNLIAAINKCDALLKERDPRRRENLKKNIKEEISTLAISNDRSRDEIDRATFFISAELESELRCLNNPESITIDEAKADLKREFNNFEKTIISIAQNNCEAKKQERINDAIKTCRRNLEQEIGRITSEVSIVKEEIRKLRIHISQSMNRIRDMRDHQFVKTAYVDDLYKLKSGREKVLVFLNHCLKNGFMDIKSTIIRQPINERISNFIDLTLQEEIEQIFGHDGESMFNTFYNLLDPVSSQTSVYTNTLYEIDQKIKYIEAEFAQTCAIKEKELQTQFENFVRSKEIAMKEREEKLEGVNKSCGKMEVAGFAGVAAGEMAVLSTLGTSTLPAISSYVLTGTLLSLGPLGWLAAAGMGASALGVFSMGYGYKNMITQKQKQEELQQLSQKFQEEIQTKETSKNQQFDEFRSQINRGKSMEILRLERESEINKRQSVEEKVKREEDYKSKHASALTAIYVNAIYFISQKLQLRLQATVNILDEIKN